MAKKEQEMYEGMSVIEASDKAGLEKKLAAMAERPEKYAVRISKRSTKIKDYAFSDCKDIKHIEIPESVKVIGGHAFDGCTGLTSIVIPDSVTSIGTGAFKDCTGLISINIPDSVTEIRGGEVIGLFATVNSSYGAFQGCSGLTSITIPDSVEVLGDLMFSDCTSLREVVLPKNLIRIDRFVFNNCVSLENIVIPTSVKRIGQNIPKGHINIFLGNPFEGCSSLKSISMTEDQKKSIKFSDQAYGDKTTRFYDSIKKLIVTR